MYFFVTQLILSFNSVQSRIVTGLLTVHNTLRRHLYIMGLLNSPLCRRFGAEEETSAPRPMFYVSVKPWVHSDILFGFLFYGH